MLRVAKSMVGAHRGAQESESEREREESTSRTLIYGRTSTVRQNIITYLKLVTNDYFTAVSLSDHTKKTRPKQFAVFFFLFLLLTFATRAQCQFVLRVS